MDGYIAIGFLQSVYRDSPFLRIQVLTDFPDRFGPGNFVFIKFFDDDPKKMEIEEVAKDKSGILIKFRNFDTPDVCDVLLHKYVYVPESELKTLPDDTYYVHDLVGSSVLLEGENIGIIQDVLQMPANDVYVVGLASGKELMVPALKEVISSFDRTAKVLTLGVTKSYFDYED